MLRYVFSFFVLAAAAPGCASIAVEPPQYLVAGIPVEYRAHAGLGGYMGSSWTEDGPVIYFHPERLPSLDADLVHFKVFHELAHLNAPGGLLHGGVSEIEADCAALSMMKTRGILTESIRARIALHMMETRGSSASKHRSGPERATYLLLCEPQVGTDQEIIERALRAAQDPSGRFR